MLIRLGPALGGEARRLVDHDRRRILIDDERADEPDLFVGKSRAIWCFLLRGFGRLLALRRDADALPGEVPVARGGALPVRPGLASACPARDLAEADFGQIAAEPAVEA